MVIYYQLAIFILLDCDTDEMLTCMFIYDNR